MAPRPKDEPKTSLSRARTTRADQVVADGNGQADEKTREAARRHRETGPERITGKHTTREIVDTTGEGGVGGSIEGAYADKPGAHKPPASRGSSRRNPAEVGDFEYGKAHGPEGDGSEDFTSELAEAVDEGDEVEEI